MKLPKEPLWKGPAESGITQSLLQKFIVCRHRFWLQTVVGLREEEVFNHKMEYGNFWHAAEEYHALGKPWDIGVNKYEARLLRRYPEDATPIQYWAKICKVQFPIYLKWAERVLDNDRKVIVAEQNFALPYKLPSGREVLLRGKFDEIYRLGHLIYLKENKVKGEIDIEGITKTVAFNLQTMMYQIAMHQAFSQVPLHPARGNGKPIPKNGSGQFIFDHVKAIPKNLPDSSKPYRIAGVLYNVIRRPLSDRFAIKQKKGRKTKVRGMIRIVGAETQAEFLNRLGTVISKQRTDYFHRWKTLLDQADVDKFRRESFDPLLEQLCDWWEWIAIDPFDPWRPRKASEFADTEPGEGWGVANPHWLTPWGVYNSLASGWRGDYFGLLTSGSSYDLVQAKTLFPELENA